ncbi:sugar-binding domain-containing protein [Coprobacter sp.]
MTNEETKFVRMLAICSILVFFCTELQTQFKIKQAPIMTKWAKEININSPHPEYPRPQMERSMWTNLNGVWEFQRSAGTNEKPPFGKKLDEKILVPFPVESALSGIMEQLNRFWYRRTFKIPSDWDGKKILLHFGAVDYEAEVFVNGKKIGLHKGGYLPFNFDITDVVKNEENELLVRVYDPTDKGGQPRGKQDSIQKGIMYTPTSGIWQTVWLEPVSKTYIKDLKIVPDIDKKEVEVTVMSNTKNAKVLIELKSGMFQGKTNNPIKIKIPNPKLWSPQNPYLYNINVSILGNNGMPMDKVNSYFGMRKISVGEVNGIKRLFVNNELVFMNGLLDQGFWPDGIYTAPTDDALRFDIEETIKMGFNFTRKHIKVEPARWYYWCDKLGLMVWQDTPSCNSYRDSHNDEPTPEIDKKAFETELTSMVNFLKNSPAVIMWVIFNEGQGQFDTERLVQVVKKQDPTRLVNDASGGKWSFSGDILDTHNYPGPSYPKPKTKDIEKAKGKVFVCGEFGGIGMKVPGHMWFEGKGSGYANVDISEDLLFKYAELYNKIVKMREKNGLAAVVYTELTDIMTEINGLFTYDRIPKINVSKIAKINTFQFKMPNFKEIVPTSEKEAQIWKYKYGPRKGAWNKENFDDSDWKEGPGAFGNAAGKKGNTPWPVADGKIKDNKGRTITEICIRRNFIMPELSPEEISRLMLRVMHDGNFDVFINGVLACNAGRANNDYEYFSIKPEALKALKIGEKNLITVYCKDTGGGRFIDVGISLRNKME